MERERFMKIKPIKTKAGHRAALKEVETLMSARRGAPEGDRLSELVKMVEAYEQNFLQELPKGASIHASEASAGAKKLLRVNSKLFKNLS